MAKAKTKRTTRNGNVLTGLWSLVVWLTGILVSLAVGFGMIEKVLTIPRIPEIVTATAGWIVVILVVLGVLIRIIDKFSK